jgi:hypothetical protein
MKTVAGGDPRPPLRHAMDDGPSPARLHEPRALVPRSPADVVEPEAGPAPPAPRPVLDPEPWTPPQLSAGFAVGWLLTTVVLGTITAVWLVGMLFSLVLLVLGQGGLWSALAFAGTGVLLGRGWVGMAQTIRGRLRRRDLADTAALPPVFYALSPALQRLVRHTRGLRIVIQDPELPLPELDRELFVWITDLAALPPEDRRVLTELGIVPSQLREELVASRHQEDRVRAPLGPRRLAGSIDHRQRALALLDRFEHEVLQPPADPFRGGRARG